MGSNSIPPKTLSDESINRGLVCAHMHFIARTQKILTFMSSTGEWRQQKHTQHAPSTKTECDYLNGWIKKKKQLSHTQKSHPKVVNPRDIAVERKKNKKKTNSSWLEVQGENSSPVKRSAFLFSLKGATSSVAGILLLSTYRPSYVTTTIELSFEQRPTPSEPSSSHSERTGDDRKTARASLVHV